MEVLSFPSQSWTAAECVVIVHSCVNGYRKMIKELARSDHMKVRLGVYSWMVLESKKAPNSQLRLYKRD